MLVRRVLPPALSVFLPSDACPPVSSRPHDTPFEDGTFKLIMEFTEEYPNKPPLVRFMSKMFHPNVYADGGICLDILQNRWSPTYDVSAILTSIQVCWIVRDSPCLGVLDSFDLCGTRTYIYLSEVGQTYCTQTRDKRLSMADLEMTLAITSSLNDDK